MSKSRRTKKKAFQLTQRRGSAANNGNGEFLDCVGRQGIARPEEITALISEGKYANFRTIARELE